jgi:hypothetical protein
LLKVAATLSGVMPFKNSLSSVPKNGLLAVKASE